MTEDTKHDKHGNVKKKHVDIRTQYETVGYLS